MTTESTPLLSNDIETAGGVEKKKKGVKKEKKNKDDDIKTHMSNERTYFKWLFFGFHVGGMGTFILTFFPTSPNRVYLVLFIWIVAFYFIYYGLFRYFTRRRAMRLGLHDPEEWDDPYAPALMAGAVILIVLVIIVYAFATAQTPSKKAWSGVGP